MQRNKDQIISEWLVLLAQSGKATALDQLLKIWYPNFLRYSTQQLRDSSAAEDAVQETLICIAKKIGSLDDPAAFPKWAYRILHRRGVDVQRKAIRLREREVSYGHAEDIEHVIVKPGVGNSYQEDIPEALRELDELSYNVVHLHYLHGLKVKEIATICSIPVGTVKSRLHTARKKLKAILEK